MNSKRLMKRWRLRPQARGVAWWIGNWRKFPRWSGKTWGQKKAFYFSWQNEYCSCFCISENIKQLFRSSMLVTVNSTFMGVQMGFTFSSKICVFQIILNAWPATGPPSIKEVCNRWHDLAPRDQHREFLSASGTFITCLVKSKGKNQSDIASNFLLEATQFTTLGPNNVAFCLAYTRAHKFKIYKQIICKWRLPAEKCNSET